MGEVVGRAGPDKVMGVGLFVQLGSGSTSRLIFPTQNQMKYTRSCLFSVYILHCLYVNTSYILHVVYF